MIHHDSCMPHGHMLNKFKYMKKYSLVDKEGRESEYIFTGLQNVIERNQLNLHFVWLSDELVYSDIDWINKSEDRVEKKKCMGIIAWKMIEWRG